MEFRGHFHVMLRSWTTMPVRFCAGCRLCMGLPVDSDGSNKPTAVANRRDGGNRTGFWGKTGLPSVQIKILPRIKETAPASVLDKFAATGFRWKEVLSEK